MDTMIVTKCFSHQGNRLGLMALALIFLIEIAVGCQRPMDADPSALSRKTDITEDLYHRLKAGLFIAGKNPVILQIVKHPNLFHRLQLPFYSIRAPREMARISWDRGSFWVAADDHALVVIYMDVEATYSHVQIETLEKFDNSRQFRREYEHPIR